MLDGKIFFGLTGIPDLNIPFENIPFALAEPEPLTLANLITNSLIEDILFISKLWPLHIETFAYPKHLWGTFLHISHSEGKHLHL